MQHPAEDDGALNGVAFAKLADKSPQPLRAALVNREGGALVVTLSLSRQADSAMQ